MEQIICNTCKTICPLDDAYLHIHNNYLDCSPYLIEEITCAITPPGYCMNT